MILLQLEDTGDGLVVKINNPLLFDIIRCITEGKPPIDYLRDFLVDAEVEVMGVGEGVQ